MEVNLLQWGEQTDPYYSVYGKVSCADIAQWYIEHGDLLFTENIRNTLSDSDINLQIEASLLKSPKDFWYLNNGITAIADGIKRKPIVLGEQRDSSYWKISNIKIVNGAQTTGSIFSAHNKAPKVTPQAYATSKK
ncbi:MAG: AIPR family protein [Simplicispira sp.]|nr:AIPR family protein [Simplicispira sp.]